MTGTSLYLLKGNWPIYIISIAKCLKHVFKMPKNKILYFIRNLKNLNFNNSVTSFFLLTLCQLVVWLPRSERNLQVISYSLMWKNHRFLTILLKITAIVNVLKTVIKCWSFFYFFFFLKWYTGSAKYLFFGNCFKKKLLYIFSIFFFIWKYNLSG